MKTFKEFIYEAEVRLYQGTLKGSGKSPFATGSDRATQLGTQVKKELSSRSPNLQRIATLSKRAKDIKTGLEKASVLEKERGHGPENKDAGRTNTLVTGYASKPRDVVSSVGTSPNVSRQRLTNLRTGEDLGSAQIPGENTSGRYSDTRSRSQRGGTVPTRNKGQGRSTPERGRYSGG